MKKWTYALARAVVQGIGMAGLAWMVDHKDFNLDKWENLGLAVLVGALIALFNHLSKSPLPENGGASGPA